MAEIIINIYVSVIEKVCKAEIGFFGQALGKICI